MTKKNPRMVMVGAGAIGGVMATLMREKGCDMTVVCKHGEIVDIAEGRGLRVTGVLGEHQANMPAVADIEELQGQFDVAFIATKAYDMPGCARRLLPMLTPDSLVVSLQNGICTDALSAVVGPERTVGCVVGFGATLLGPGELCMTSTGELIIGRMQGDQTDLEPVREAMCAVAPTVIRRDIYAQLYSKLIINSCITSLGAICGLKLGKMLLMRRARQLFLSVIGEAVAVARALGLTLPPYGGKLDYEKLMAGEGWASDLRRRITLLAVGFKYRRLKSSSLQSLERGRPTEIDYFNGFIAQKGEEMGIPCPVNRRLTQMIKEIEGGKRSIKVDNLSDAQLMAKGNAVSG